MAFARQVDRVRSRAVHSVSSGAPEIAPPIQPCNQLQDPQGARADDRSGRPHHFESHPRAL